MALVNKATHLIHKEEMVHGATQWDAMPVSVHMYDMQSAYTEAPIYVHAHTAEHGAYSVVCL